MKEEGPTKKVISWSDDISLDDVKNIKTKTGAIIIIFGFSSDQNRCKNYFFGFKTKTGDFLISSVVYFR